MQAAWLSSLVREAVRGGATLGADRQLPAIGRRNARDTSTLRWIFRFVYQAWVLLAQDERIEGAGYSLAPWKPRALRQGRDIKRWVADQLKTGKGAAGMEAQNLNFLKRLSKNYGIPTSGTGTAWQAIKVGNHGSLECVNHKASPPPRMHARGYRMRNLHRQSAAEWGSPRAQLISTVTRTSEATVFWVLS
jgi:hypothetical protein